MVQTAEPFSQNLPNPTADRWPEPQRRSEQSPPVNVGREERWASVVGAAVLAYGGMKIRGLSGLALIGGAVMLAKRGYTGHCALNSLIGRDTSGAEPEDYYERGVRVEEAFTIAKPRQELFDYWRQFENLPRFMQHVNSVTASGDGLWHWEVKGPAGINYGWDALIVNEVPGELIAWQSVPGAQVDNAGSVRFITAPGDRGTEVRVAINYIPPAGSVGKWIATLLGSDPQMLLRSDLRRFKQLMEAGHIPTTEGQPMGTCRCESRTA